MSTYHVTATGSVFAVGPESTATNHGTVIGSAQAAAATLRDQLDRLGADLAGLPPGREVGAAEVRLADLRETVASEPVDGSEVRRGWARLQAALATVAAVGVTGATAFGADIAQIASTIASAW